MFILVLVVLREEEAPGPGNFPGGNIHSAGGVVHKQGQLKDF